MENYPYRPQQSVTANQMAQAQYAQSSASNGFYGDRNNNVNMASADSNGKPAQFNPFVGISAPNLLSANSQALNPGSGAIRPPYPTKVTHVSHVSKASLKSLSALVADSFPEFSLPRYANQSQNQDGPADSSDTMTITSQFSPLINDDIHASSFIEGVFTTSEDCRRSIVIKRISAETKTIDIMGLFKHARFPSLKQLDTTNLDSDGIVYLSFGDIRDAVKAFDSIISARPDWKATYLSAREFARKGDKSIKVNKITEFEGRLDVLVNFSPYVNPSARALLDAIKIHFGTYAAIKAIHAEPSIEPFTKRVEIEYYDAEKVAQAVFGLGKTFESYEFKFCQYQPDVDKITPPTEESSQLNGQIKRSPTLDQDDGRAFQLQSSHALNQALNIHNVVHQDHFGKELAVRKHREYHPSHFQYQSRPHHGRHSGETSNNHVFTDMIHAGLDVRTTIMIRNIPNKVNQTELKAILDATSFGQYDFMYLRIDFANECNVGYAFVNFADPMAIIAFVEARAGQRWSAISPGSNAMPTSHNGRNRYYSDKVAEVSYATIQGRDCLIQKFRNSSVMREHHLFRPKLYYTLSDGSQAGREEKFPTSDNEMKMRRSMANASTIGLFAPRAGQQYREEQRNRRSQFDRGTTAAEYEHYMEGHSDPSRNVLAPFFLSAPAHLQSFYHY